MRSGELHRRKKNEVRTKTPARDCSEKCRKCGKLQRKALYANGLRPKKDERSGYFEDEIRPLSGDAGALHDAFCAGFSEDAHGACERSGGRSEAAH